MTKLDVIEIRGSVTSVSPVCHHIPCNMHLCEVEGWCNQPKPPNVRLQSLLVKYYIQENFDINITVYNSESELDSYCAKLFHIHKFPYYLVNNEYKWTT